MNQALFKKVRRFVHNATLKPLLQIKPETSLYFDLDLDMTSAAAFFEKFATAFEIDLEGMDLVRHFHPISFVKNTMAASDGGAGTIASLLWWGVSDRHQFQGIKPLLVSDLVVMARAKRWCL